MSVPEPPDYIVNDELAVVAWRNAYTLLVGGAYGMTSSLRRSGFSLRSRPGIAAGKWVLWLRGKKRLKARHFD